VALGCSGVQSVVVAVILVVSVGGIFIGVIVGSVVVGSSRKSSSTMSAVDCVKGCVSWGVRVMGGVSPISVFAVVSEIAVVVIVIGSVVVGSGSRKLSSKSSATLAVRCISGGV